MKKILLFLVIVLILFSTIKVFSEPIYKRGIDEPDVLDESCIVAYDHPVSGSNWLRKDGGRSEYCNIIHINDAPLPNNTLLEYQVTTRRNRFLFYVDYYEEGMDIDGTPLTTYYVSGWDVIKPVRHSSYLRDIVHGGALTEVDLHKYEK